jgi:outer membrane protein TolC
MLPTTLFNARNFVKNIIVMNSKTYFLSLAFTTIVSLNLFAHYTYAQGGTKTLSLQEAIEKALSNNAGIRLAKLDENIASANYKQTEAVFLPQVGLSYTAMTTNDPLNSFGFKLEQRTITPNDFNSALLNHPTATQNYMAKLEVQQPLLNVDMLYMRKGAQKQTEVYQYKTQRTKEYLTFEVQKAYLQLQLAYNAVNVLEETLQNVQSVYTFTDNHFKQGLIQKTDLLNAQVQVTTVESNLNKAKSNIRNASDMLSLLMGQPSDVVYKADATEAKQVADTTLKITASRSDFMAMNKAIEASGLVIKSTQMSYLPKLNAFGNYQYNDSHLTGFGANSYLVGIQLSWDIFKGNKRKNTITIQKLERDKLSEELAQQKDQSQLELNKAYRDLSDARFEIDQDQAAITQATESLRILKNRYQQGLVNTTDVLMAETQLSQQKFALVQARFTLNLTGYYIQLLTPTTIK